MQDKYFSQEFIEKVKSKNDIVSIIGKYVRLEKKGRDYWGCCPFHHEKTPSFVVHGDEQYFHCFGCGESGNVITFLTKYENWDYPTAIKHLAELAGLELPQFEDNEKYKQQKKLKDKCTEILNLAREIYKKNIYLPQAKLAQDYIKKRKVTRKELDNFELGYSLGAFDIVNKLKEKNFTAEELKASGVCEIGKSGKPYDFLTERLIFPIVNTFGDCIGFSGRDLTGASHVKYKNTSATILFNKSKTVYGINLIKKLKQEKGLNNIVIVEGQFDVITMHRYGFQNAVACLGTAITELHIREMKRFVDNIVLCLDGDDAGRKATLRAIELFSKFPDVNLKIAILPNGQDPDEILSQTDGTNVMKKILNNTVSPMDFKIFLLKNKYNLNKTDEKSTFVKEILKEIAKLPTSAEQEIYLTEIKELTNISVDILRRTLPSATKEQVQIENPQEVQNKEFDGNTKAVIFVLASLLFEKDYIKKLKDVSNIIFNPKLEEIYDFIKTKQNAGEKNIISSLYDENIEDEFVKQIVNYNFNEIEKPEEYVKNCLWAIVEGNLKFRKLVLSKQYKEEIDSNVKMELLKNIANIDIQLKNKNLGEFIDE